MDKIVIFDLDGTLALIDTRRALSTDVGTSKMNWDTFFDPKNIDLDVPNKDVIKMADLLSNNHRIWILSGRSDVTYQATVDWLNKHDIWCDHLVMRPQNHLYLPDNDLKQMWLDNIGVDNVAMVFDDRNQVVDMWRKNGLTCFQVADGDF